MNSHKETVLVLRTCDADGRSRNGFIWPKAGTVACDDWNPEPVCGGGLHGLLWGVGDGKLLNWRKDTRWLVVEVDADSVVDIGGDKVKFPRGVVVHCGDRKSATDYLLANGAAGKAVAGAVVTVGDKGTATTGYKGTATAGYEGTATAGEGGILNIKWWDGNRRRIATAYVGETGILPNVRYRVDAQGKFIEARV